VLNVGCGNSIFPEDMYDDGFTNNTSFDISPHCIEQMKKRNKEKRPEMQWDVMDATDLKYETGQFDLIVDKSTIDCLLCGYDGDLNVAMMLKECQRTLKEGGFYVLISFGKPDQRQIHFDRKFMHIK